MDFFFSLNCQIALQKYVEYYPAFEVSREHKLLKVFCLSEHFHIDGLYKMIFSEEIESIIFLSQGLCSEVEQENDEGFEEIVRKNKTLVGLDPWYGKVINRVRREIPGELNSLR